VCGVLGRYWYFRKFQLLWSLYKRISWRISELFPPLFPPLAPSHLARWKEVWEGVKGRCEFKCHLESLKTYQDLKEFQKYIGPGFSIKDA
jgi:hypothetical protein